MRKFLIVAAALFLVPSVSFAQQGDGTGLGPHDLSSNGGESIKTTQTTQRCVFCHVPHAQTSSPGGKVGTATPLWNHTLTSQNLTWQTSTTLRGSTLWTVITSTQLEGSRACLSCHDGTVALGNIARYYNTSTGNWEAKSFTMTGNNVTADKLSSNSGSYINTSQMAYNHPIGVKGPPADKDGFTAFVQSEPTSTNNGVWYKSSSSGSDKYVQCGSCHNPHLTTNKPFLRKNNNGSDLCLQCHDI